MDGPAVGNGGIDFQTCRPIVAASILPEYYKKGAVLGDFLGNYGWGGAGAGRVGGGGSSSEAGFAGFGDDQDWDHSTANGCNPANPTILIILLPTIAARGVSV